MKQNDSIDPMIDSNVPFFLRKNEGKTCSFRETCREPKVTNPAATDLAFFVKCDQCTGMFQKRAEKECLYSTFEISFLDHFSVQNVQSTTQLLKSMLE